MIHQPHHVFYKELRTRVRCDSGALVSDGLWSRTGANFMSK